MFRIHREQVEAIGASRRARFEAAARAEIAARWPELPNDAAFIHASVDRAIAEGIETEPYVGQYLLMEGVAGGALRKSWGFAAEVLDHPRLTPLGKLRTLLRRAGASGIDVARIDLDLR